MLHLCLITYCFAQSDTGNNYAGVGIEHVITGFFIGGRFLDSNSTLLFCLVLVNLLPIIIDQGLLKIVIFLLPHLNVEILSWVKAYQLVVLTSLQWLLLGHFIERMIKLFRGTD